MSAWQRYDNFVLLRAPRLWQLRAHIYVPVCALAVVLAVMAGTLLPLDDDARNMFSMMLGIGAFAIFLLWAVSSNRYNAWRAYYPMSRSGWAKEFLTLWVMWFVICTLPIALIVGHQINRVMTTPLSLITDRADTVESIQLLDFFISKDIQPYSKQWAKQLSASPDSPKGPAARVLTMLESNNQGSLTALLTRYSEIANTLGYTEPYLKPDTRLATAILDEFHGRSQWSGEHSNDNINDSDATSSASQDTRWNGWQSFLLRPDTDANSLAAMSQVEHRMSASASIGKPYTYYRPGSLHQLLSRNDTQRSAISYPQLRGMYNDFGPIKGVRWMGVLWAATLLAGVTVTTRLFGLRTIILSFGIGLVVSWVMMLFGAFGHGESEAWHITLYGPLALALAIAFIYEGKQKKWTDVLLVQAIGFTLISALLLAEWLWKIEVIGAMNMDNSLMGLLLWGAFIVLLSPLIRRWKGLPEA